MPELTKAAHLAFSLGAMEAEQLGSAEIDVEHFFLGLCKLEAFRDADEHVLQGLSAEDARDIREECAAFAKIMEAAGLDATKARRRLRALWRDAHAVKDRFSGHRTQRCRDVFTRADALASGRTDAAAFMRAVLDAPSPMLDQLLTELNLGREQLQAAWQAAAPGETIAAHGDAPERKPSAKPDAAGRYGRDLTKLARDGKLHPAIGRDHEIKRVAQILLQAKKNNPMLVGDAGVGKTAIVEALALKLADAGAPPALRGVRIVEIALGALVAGTKYRGEFEERVEAILKQAESDSSLVIFIDEIHMLLGAGGGSGAMDAANLLKPALARGVLRCVGATTTAEYRQHIEKDAALERRFQVVWVEEPSRDVAVAILDGLRPMLERHHGVQIEREAVEKAVDLSIRYLPDFRLPDKAIDVIDQACARAMLSTFSLPKHGQEAAKQIGAAEIAAVISERCRVPVEQVTAQESERLLEMEGIIGRRVIGQPRAVEFVSRAIRAAKAGLKDPRRPVGVFLFLGPTGTGKTELAKALAEFLFGNERLLIRIDMSEFAEKHSIAKLIGSPPGYVGHEEGGRLTEQVRTHPYSVVLFDEIEKAHPDVFDLFLQIFDEGRLTDSRGRQASFADTVIILTSNLGAQEAAAPAARPMGVSLDAAALGRTGGGKAAEATGDGAAESEYEKRQRAAIARALRPELLNRIQQVIHFRALDAGAIRRIVDKILAGVRERLQERGLQIAVSDSAYDVLMQRGYDPKFGAREMERAVDQLLVQPLGRALLESRFAAGCTISVGGKDGVLVFEQAAAGKLR